MLMLIKASAVYLEVNGGIRRYLGSNNLLPTVLEGTATVLEGTVLQMPTQASSDILDYQRGNC